MDYLEIGCTPTEEPCANVGEPDYARRARAECRALIGQLERAYPCPCPGYAHLVTRANPHDFGTYYEVAVKYDENDAQACDWAYLLEAGLPDHWDKQAKQELALSEARAAAAAAATVAAWCNSAGQSFAESSTSKERT